MKVPNNKICLPRSAFLQLSHSAFLDAFFVICALEDGVDKNSGCVDPVRRKLAEIDQLLNFGDNVIGGGSHHGIKVACGFAIDEIAPAVAFPGFDKREISAEGAFEYVAASVEVASFLAVGDHGAVTGGGVAGGGARSAGAKTFRESSLRV